MSHYSENIKFLTQKHPSINLDGLSENYANQPTPDDLAELSKRFDISIDTLIKKDLESGSTFDFSTIKFLVLDVDGVMTDGGMYYTQGGDEFKKFNTKDGMGIKRLVKKGMNIGVISSGINEKLIGNRAELLGIEFVYVGLNAKLPVLSKWCDSLEIGLKNVAYIGDDVNDLAIMKEVGISACPADAIEEIKNTATINLQKKGGEGCIREFIDAFLNG